ncbi:MAG: Uma2 family endonuclease [Acidobacteria bacterium]|nr:Uma2 family endonuclease [Acidobacteriota bacterium]
MATTATALMKVDEFLKLPEPVGDHTLDLHRGEVVRVTRPKLKRTILQKALQGNLEAAAPPGSFVTVEMPFRSEPEHELRCADVGYVSPERWATIDTESVFQGAPDLVVEVLSPSNTAAEILEKEQICLENGCREFWVVDPNRRHLRVTTSDGRIATYKPGQSVPLDVLGGGTLPVDSIFV